MSKFELLNARPHPDPLPQREGTAAGHSFPRVNRSSRWPLSFLQIAASVSPSTWGEGWGEEGCFN